METIISKEQEFCNHEQLFKDKVVLDLACHDGESTKLIYEHGSKHIHAVEARESLVAAARSRVPKGANFYVGDIQNPVLIEPLVEKSNCVVVLGVLYHLYNHFGFFNSILKPNIEYVLIETLAGSESLNPEMYWGFEKIDHRFAGWHDRVDIIPNGTPNISWILNSADIFGFSCDYVNFYGRVYEKNKLNVTMEEYMAIRDSSWPDYNTFLSQKDTPKHILEDIEKMLGDENHPLTEKRVFLRLYNKKLIQSTPLQPEDIYIWKI